MRKKFSRRNKMLVGVLVISVFGLIYAGWPIFADGMPPDNKPGSAAGFILRDWPYPNLHIESDSEVPISNGTLSSFSSFVQTYTGKRPSFSISEVSFGREIWEGPDISSAESKHRGCRPYGFLEICIWMLLVDGVFLSPFSGIGGRSYQATSIALFWSAIRTQEGLSALMAHEFSHLIGLCGVALEQPEGADWQCDGNGHSLNPDSLMYPHINLDSSYVKFHLLMLHEADMLEYIRANHYGGIAIMAE